MKLKRNLKGFMSVSKLIVMVVGAVILGSLIGTIADSTIGINQSISNVTGTSHTMIALVPLFLVIAIVVSYISDT